MFLLTAFRSFALLIFCFSLSFIANGQPGNDDPSAATLLTSAVTCSVTTGTIVGSNSSGKIGCITGNVKADVWYKFVAQSTEPTISLSGVGGNFSSPGLQIFSSATLSNATSVACGSTSLSTSGLTIGTIYYVRVYSSSAAPSSAGGFSICVTDPAPPANDECSSATLLTYNVAKTLETVSYATNSGVSMGTCTGTADDDVWYKFAATSANTIVSLSNVGADLSASGAMLQVFSGACGSLTSIACGTNGVTLTGLTTSPSTTYYIRVYSSGTGNLSSNANFDITITTPPAPPTNDDCAGAATLTVGTGYNSTVWGATDSGLPTVCAGTPDDDVWFKFTPAATSATINLSAVGGNLSTSGAMIQVFSGSCGSLNSIACGSSGMAVLGLTAGTTYYARVYSAGSGSIGGTSTESAFTITVTQPTSLSTVNGLGSRMNEIFKQTILSPANQLNDPWEIAYGPDGFLWITEAKGYKLYRMDPNTGTKSTVLDVSQNSTFLPATDRTFNCQFSNGSGAQGGFAGMVLHPKFMDPVTPKNYVYISYVHSQTSTYVFVNRVVRFTYNTNTSRLESPVSLCDTIPGSSDHNSQRMIIAPVGGTDYLFYAAGDMGAGQFQNAGRAIKSQIIESYEGKILRFNLETDGESGLNQWIPNDNPFNNLPKQSAVWVTGMRNNQGFAYNSSTDKLYGSSHGPFSDDEVNIIERAKNYGHPIVIGFNDGNYDGAKAGISSGTLPLITSEAANVASIINSGQEYSDPIYSFFAAPKGNTTTPGTIQYIYNQFNTGNQNNSSWPSMAPSGMDVYTHTAIPGWKNSLLIGFLKGGRVMRLKLKPDGSGVVAPSTGTDSTEYFRSQNRFRDIALTPDGKTIFTVIDKSQTTSGPTTGNPMISLCAGCVQKYTFLGYADAGGKSTISSLIDVTLGANNTCNPGTTITIDNSNNNLWVPITGPDGNIMAEIKANGNNLGTVTSSFYTNSGAVRENALKRLYLDRNITITPQTQPSSPVSIRLYLTASEFNALKNAANSKGPSGVSSISNISIYKNNDGCGATWANTATPAIITPIYAEAHGSNGFVLQADISSFSSFYFANTNSITLPLQLLNFKGALQNNAAFLQWETANETNTSHFVVERSIDGNNFSNIGTVAAAGNSRGAQKYDYTDDAAIQQSSSTLYYRLKMVDLNGDFTYSKVITIVLKSSNYTVALYPNPIHDVLKVRLTLSKAEQVQILVTDMNGRIIYKESRFAPTGISELQVNSKAWPSQLYSVRVTGTSNNTLVTQNVIKL